MSERTRLKIAPEASPLEETLTLAARIVSLGKQSVNATGAAAEGLPALKSIVECVSALQALRPTLVQYSADTERAATEEFAQLQESLREACTHRRWQFDGQWPTFYVERAIPVTIDESRRSAKVGHVRVPVASVVAIVEALSSQLESLLGPKFVPAAFLADLAEAYRTLRPSGPAPLFDIYRALIIRSQRARFWRDATPKDFLSLSADQFRARLSKVLEVGATSAPDGRHLRLSPPLNPQEGLFIYLPDERRFAWVGFIEFVEGHDA